MEGVRPKAPQVLRAVGAIVAVSLVSLLALGVASAAETGSGGLTGYGGTTGSGGGGSSPPSSPSGVVTGPESVVVAAAHMASEGGCVARSTYVATVSGSGIASTTFVLDRHKVKTVTHSPFSARIKIQAGRTHHLAIRVTFVSATKAPARTLHQTLARCATSGSRVGAATEPKFKG
jgi:hypothetical protein